MTHRKQLIVLAGTYAQAKRHADARGIHPTGIIWPRNVSDLAGTDHLPLYIAPSAWSHIDAHRLIEYAANRLTTASRLHTLNRKLSR